MEDTETPKPKHHPFSPSRLNQLYLCPGSYRMQLNLPETTSPEADEGTRLHAAVASKSLDGLDTEQAAAVQFCLDFLENLIEERKSEGKTIIGIACEFPVRITGDDGQILTEGIADVIVSWSGLNEFERPVTGGDVIDWKFGRREVPAVRENFQTAAYSLGAHQLYNFDTVTAHIVQPRIFKAERTTFTRFAKIRDNISFVINAAAGDDVILRASEDACRYCGAKSFCPAFAAKFAALVPNQEQPHDLTDPARLLDYWNRAQAVEKFIGELKARVTEYIREHGPLGDWTLTERAGKREIRDTAALYERVSGLLTSSELAECYTVSVSAVIDKLAAGAVTREAATGQKLSMKAARERAEELLADIIVRGTPTQTLTRKKGA